MRRLQGLGFAAFCLLAGSRWLVENAFPSELPVLLQQSLHYGVIAAVALVLWMLRTRRLGRAAAPLPWVKLAVSGVLLMALPALLQEFAAPVMEHDGAALFALVPLFVVVGAASYGAAAYGRGLMTPALVGVAGALLLLPFQLPSTAYGAGMFALVVAAVLVTAGVSVWLYELLEGLDVSVAVAVLCGASLLVVLPVALVRGPVSGSSPALSAEVLRCVLLDLPQVYLLVWLLREVPPSRLSARYLVVPLLTALEGVIVLRPILELRVVIGFLLMAAGGAALLFWHGQDESVSPSSLGLR
jgi:drug/metabolite transporter (DMT)-like permease